MKQWFWLTLAVWLVPAGIGMAAAGGNDAGMAAPYRMALGVGHLQAAGLGEASGMAVSRRQADLLWAVNDSGNPPVLFALSSRGAARGAVRVAGVENVDWEDLAAFRWQGQAYLLLADTGDNRARRREVALHVVAEPEPNAAGRFSGEVRPAWTLRFRYEDGPRDCEAVAVDERTGQVLLVSKRTKPPVLYRLPLRPAASDAVLIARRLTTVAGLPAPTAVDLEQPYGRYRSQPTALDIDPTALRAVLLTYKDAYLFSRCPQEPWAATFARPPRCIRLPEADFLPQREALCFASDGRSLLVTSEGENAPIFRLAPAALPKN
jgi:hypothetical protein